MREKRKSHKTLLLLVLIWLIACLPLFVPGIDDRDGQDLAYHLLRIQSIADGLAAGEFPARIQADWLNGYGYPLSVYYGDLLLYLPAALRMIGLPLLLAYKIYAALVMAGTVALSYYSFGRIFGKEGEAGSSTLPIALSCTAAYTLASYHLVNTYVRQACGEYTAMTWLPLIAAAAYGMYTEDAGDDNWKAYSKNACQLAIGMTGLIYAHILSTEMTVLVLACVCLFFLKKTFRKNTMRAWGRAIWITALATAAFTVPFLDYCLNVDVYVTADTGNIRAIQADGVRLWDYIASAVSLRVFGNTYTGASDGHVLALTPGLLLMAVAVIGLAMCVRELVWKIDKKRGLPEKTDGCGNRIIILTTFSLVTLWVSSNLFPWNFIAYSVPGGNFLTQVQFPWRYLGIGCIFLALLLGSLLARYDRGERFGKVCYGLALAMGLFFFAAYLLGADIHSFRDLSDLDTTYIGRAEYLRVGSTIDEMTGEVIADGNAEATIAERSGTSMIVSVDNASDQTCEIIFPVLNYKGYRVSGDSGESYDIYDGPNNEVAVTIPAGYSGTLYLYFKAPLYWTLAAWVSFITALILAFQMYKRRKQTDYER